MLIGGFSDISNSCIRTHHDVETKCKHQWRMTSLGEGVKFAPYGRIDYHCVDITILWTGVHPWTGFFALSLVAMDGTIGLAR